MSFYVFVGGGIFWGLMGGGMRDLNPPPPRVVFRCIASSISCRYDAAAAGTYPGGKLGLSC